MDLRRLHEISRGNTFHQLWSLKEDYLSLDVLVTKCSNPRHVHLKSVSINSTLSLPFGFIINFGVIENANLSFDEQSLSSDFWSISSLSQGVQIGSQTTLTLSFTRKSHAYWQPNRANDGNTNWAPRLNDDNIPVNISNIQHLDNFYPPTEPWQVTCFDSPSKLIAAWTSPGKVVGVPKTPPRRTSWIPTSPSPLRNSFTTNSGLISNDDTDEDDEGILFQGKCWHSIVTIKVGRDRSAHCPRKRETKKKTKIANDGHYSSPTIAWTSTSTARFTPKKLYL